MSTFDKILADQSDLSVELYLTPAELSDLLCDLQVTPYLTPKTIKSVEDGEPFYFLGHKVRALPRSVALESLRRTVDAMERVADQTQRERQALPAHLL